MAATPTQKTVDNALSYYRDMIVRIKRFDGKFRTRQEARARARLNRAWKKQIEWLLEFSQALTQFQIQEESSVVRIETKRFEREIQEFVNDLPFNEDVVEGAMISAEASFIKGGKKTFRQFGLGALGLSFDLVNEDAVAYLASRTDLLLSDSRGSVTRTTKKRIIKILTDAADNGTSYTETAKLIQQQGKAGVFSRARAEMIAVREVGLAYGEGNLAPVKRYEQEFGTIIEKIWITSMDDRVTAECANNEAQGWLGIDDIFPHTGVQLVAPRSDHPRCRCDTGYREVDVNGTPV
jgi:hypothetical protein